MALLARASGNAFQFSNSTTRIPDNKQKYVVYDDVMFKRQDQARRSILVQVHSEQSSSELYNYCSQYGKVKEMHHYTVKDNLQFLLIEFSSLSDIASINSVSTHANGNQGLPITSPIVWFRAAAKSKKSNSISTDIPLQATNAKLFPSKEMIANELYTAKSVSNQMTVLHDLTKLNDTDTRLRFLTARQIETSLSGMFPDISVLPFGSSVNGMGKHGCDLDLVLRLQGDIKNNVHSRLIYHTKVGGDLNERNQTQKVMEIISDIMTQFLPGITSVRRIFKARVPIIKYNQTLTGLECDLSMTNTVGIYMSELLYLYGELDWRVRPLIFTVKLWATSVQLTNSTPGSWITNFALTLLILFYLQQRQVLPTVKQLVKLADKSDVRIADGHVDCTFLRDISKLPPSSTNNHETLEELLKNFFIYYSDFDFVTKSVSLSDGIPIFKTEDSNIHIHNPLEHGLNVTKNISVPETERLKVEMRNAAWLLESIPEDRKKAWGILSLVYQRPPNFASQNSDHKTRMVEVSTLFRKSRTAADSTTWNGHGGTNNATVADYSNGTENTTSTIIRNNERHEVDKGNSRSGHRQERRRR